MPVLSYPTADFVAYTKISSSDMNGKLNAIKTLLNTTKLDSTNVQLHGLTRDRLGAGTANYAVYNDSSGYLTEAASLPSTAGGLGFIPTISAGNAGKVVGVNDAGSALELRVPSAADIIEQFANDVPTFTAGGAITLNDAVAVVLNEGAYKIVQADADGVDTNSSYIGFALATATVTAQVTTIAISPAAWTSGTATVRINGRDYAQAFSSNHNTSVDALCTQIQADVDVNTCAATGTPRDLITITGEGALTLTVSVQANPTGATLGTPATPTPPVGSSVRVKMFGTLTGMSSLVLGNRYYTSTTPGQITNAPTASAVFVGHAISSTVLLINPQLFAYQFPLGATFIRSHGSSDGTTSTIVQDVEHYNFSAWSSGTSSAAGARVFMGAGESAYGGNHHQLDGSTAAPAVSALFQKYNKTSWTTLTNRSNPTMSHSLSPFNNFLYGNSGTTIHGTPASAQTQADKWNTSAWSSGTAWTAGKTDFATFSIGSTLSFVGGVDISSGITANHQTRNTSDSVSSATSFPNTTTSNCGARSSNSAGGMISNASNGAAANNTNTGSWNGSAWSTALSASYSQYSAKGQAAYNSSGNLFITNGGQTAGSSGVIATSQSYNGTAFASVTSSSSSRSMGVASVI